MTETLEPLEPVMMVGGLLPRNALVLSADEWDVLREILGADDDGWLEHLREIRDREKGTHGN